MWNVGNLTYLTRWIRRLQDKTTATSKPPREFAVDSQNIHKTLQVNFSQPFPLVHDFNPQLLQRSCPVDLWLLSLFSLPISPFAAPRHGTSSQTLVTPEIGNLLLLEQLDMEGSEKPTVTLTTLAIVYSYYEKAF